MRQFLNLQEQVMYQFLSGTQAQPLAPPVLNAPKHNISQVSSPTISPLKTTPTASDFSGNAKSYSTQQLHQEPEPEPKQDVRVADTVKDVPKAPEIPVTVAPPAPSPDIISSASSQVAVTQPTQESTLDRATLEQILVSLVSDRTGYPAEMLGLEQDLEAELGIDSIKRVEILGALQKQLPGAFANGIKTQMDKLTRVVCWACC
ncbi:MAG: hypothetical protein F6K35_32250 [Okeania sp. SIO2H7]|nr:hypothetical protein [Okeania sp. SIO2H7]